MLKGKNIIVTGARKGIGRAIVEKAAKEGANVWACARRSDIVYEAELASTAKRYSSIIKPVYFDMNSESEIKNAVKEILKDKCPIDGLVNNAGIASYEKLQMLRIEDAKKIFNNNYFSALYLTQLIMRRITRENGSIVFISSIAGFIPEIGNMAYGGSKIAVAHAAKILAAELASDGIRVNAVAPGLIDTDMKDKATDEAWVRMIERTQLKRAGKPEEVASVVCFLLSDQAGYITGQTIHTDGGFS